MKKLLLTVLVFSAVFSCVKQPDAPAEPVADSPSQTARRVVIGASLPGETKVFVEEDELDLKNTWEDGDFISVVFEKGGQYYNEFFTLQSGGGTSSGHFINESSVLEDGDEFMMCYPPREKSDEGTWAMLLGDQLGIVETLGVVLPFVGKGSSINDPVEMNVDATILRLSKGLKLFTSDTEEGAILNFTVSGEHLYATVVYDGITPSGNKGPVVLSADLTTTNGCLDQNVYVVLHLADAGLTDTKLDIQARRGPSIASHSENYIEYDVYNWELDRSGKTMENGQMYSIRPGTDGTHPALPPQRLKTAELVPLEILFVSTEGDDTNTGDIDSPLKTLQEAFDRAEPGTHIYLRGSRDSENPTIYNSPRAWLRKSGTQDHPIVVTPYPYDNKYECVVLDGSDLTNLYDTDDAFIALLGPLNNPSANPNVFSNYTGANWVIIGDLEIRNAPAIGIGVDCGSSHVTIKNCTIDNCPGPGIGVGFLGGESEDITIQGVYLKNCATASREAISLRKVNGFQLYNNMVENTRKEGIDAKNGSRNGVIFGNNIKNAGHVGIYVDAGYITEPGGLTLNAGQSVPHTRNIHIYANLISYVDSEEGGTGIAVASEQGNDASDLYIYNNVVCNVSAFPGSAPSAFVPSAGIKVAKNSDLTTGLLKDVYIYNNTVYNMSQQGIYVNYPTIDNIVIRNNIVACSQAGDIQLNTGVGVPEDKVIIQNNMFFNANGSSTTHPGFPYYNETDPDKVFVRYLWEPTDWERTIDLHLPAGGTAIGNGTFLTAPDRDFDGKLRSLPVDIGAYQH